MTNDEIRSRLFELQDKEYKKFHESLIPGVEPDDVIGIRVPVLKKLAAEIYKSGEYDTFLNEIPHKYYDEMTCHALILNNFKDYDRVVTELDRFLPYVNNWATCDSLTLKKAFTNNRERLLNDISRWIKADDTYTVRFAIKMLMSYYLDDAFSTEYNDMVASVKSDEYYVKMMVAWYYATALAKQYETTISYIENRSLEEWIHKKAIQKARESFRITKEHKDYLNTLK